VETWAKCETIQLTSSATQNSSCTHIVANGGLSGSKTQKWINGQGGRGGLKRLKVITVDCESSLVSLLHIVDCGIALSLSLSSLELWRVCGYTSSFLTSGVLDSVEKRLRLSEVGYGVVEDPVSCSPAHHLECR